MTQTINVFAPQFANNAMNLEKEWTNLASKCTFNDKLVRRIYREFEAKYNSSNRHYHNLTHIQNMLSTAKEFQKEMSDPDVVNFAIWFHDFVYNPIRKDNEEQSAKKARTYLKKLNYAKIKIEEVESLILKTKNHFDYLDEQDFNSNIFLDCDLLILGAEKKDYLKYTEQIRKEYRWIPDFMYKKGRIKVLENFLSNPKIYRTEVIRGVLEENARKNLFSELRELQVN